jgi:hypothetical protein
MIVSPIKTPAGLDPRLALVTGGLIVTAGVLPPEMTVVALGIEAGFVTSVTEAPFAAAGALSKDSMVPPGPVLEAVVAIGGIGIALVSTGGCQPLSSPTSSAK